MLVKKIKFIFTSDFFYKKKQFQKLNRVWKEFGSRFMNRTEQMVYLKIPVGNNAHENTQHTILFTNMAEDSVV